MTTAADTRMGQLVAELAELEERLRQGGGPAKIEKQHSQGKLTARERVELLLDPGGGFLEIGLLVAYDQYDERAPAAGVLTGVGEVCGREVVIVANDATVKAGSWWPETITKMLRASGDRDAVPHPDHLSGRLGGREPSVPGAACFRGSTARAGSSTTTRSCGTISRCLSSPP